MVWKAVRLAPPRFPDRRHAPARRSRAPRDASANRGLALRRTGTARGANHGGSKPQQRSLHALYPDEVPRAARLHRRRSADRRTVDLPVLGAHSSVDRADRAGHWADRVQPVHELRARRLESGADGRAQPDRRRRRHRPRRLAVDLRLRRRDRPTCGCLTWPWASQRSSSASRPCSRPATRTARAAAPRRRLLVSTTTTKRSRGSRRARPRAGCRRHRRRDPRHRGSRSGGLCPARPG